jgi:hypothetical protein
MNWTNALPFAPLRDIWKTVLCFENLCKLVLVGEVFDVDENDAESARIFDVLRTAY